MQNLLAVKCQMDNHFDGCSLQLHKIILTLDLNSKKITDRLKLFAEIRKTDSSSVGSDSRHPCQVHFQ